MAVRIFNRIHKPRMFAGGVIHHKINHHADIAGVGFVEKVLVVLHGAIIRMGGAVIYNIIFVIGGRRVDRHQPKSLDAEIIKIIEFGGKSFEIADAIAEAVGKSVNENFVGDRMGPFGYNIGIIGLIRLTSRVHKKGNK